MGRRLELQEGVVCGVIVCYCMLYVVMLLNVIVCCCMLFYVIVSFPGFASFILCPIATSEKETTFLPERRDSPRPSLTTSS